VWALLKPSYETPFNATHPPKQLRIRKAFLDFTRMDGCDGGRNAAAAAAKSSKAKAKAHAAETTTPANALSVPAEWWRSTSFPPRMYLPTQSSADSVVLRRLTGEPGQEQQDQCALMHAQRRQVRATWNEATAVAFASSVGHANGEGEGTGKEHQQQQQKQQKAARAKLAKLTPRLFPLSASAKTKDVSSITSLSSFRSALVTSLARLERLLLPLPRSYGPMAPTIVRELRRARRGCEQLFGAMGEGVAGMSTLLADAVEQARAAVTALLAPLREAPIAPPVGQQHDEL